MNIPMPQTPAEVAELLHKELTEEQKTELWNKGPQIKGNTEDDWYCPIDDGRLIVSAQQNGPDDYYLIALCPECKERWDD